MFPLNRFVTPPEPKDCRVLVFHGRPFPDQAIEGFDGGLLRSTLPAPWLADHWLPTIALALPSRNTIDEPKALADLPSNGQTRWPTTTVPNNPDWAAKFLVRFRLLCDCRRLVADYRANGFSASSFAF